MGKWQSEQLPVSKGLEVAYQGVVDVPMCYRHHYACSRKDMFLNSDFLKNLDEIFFGTDNSKYVMNSNNVVITSIRLQRVKLNQMCQSKI